MYRQFYINGHVYDDTTLNGIEGITISINTITDKTISVKSDKDGWYELRFSLEVKDDYKTIIEKSEIQFVDNKGKYSIQSIKPFDLDGTIKDIVTVRMILIKKNLDSNIQSQKQKINKGISSSLKTIKKPAEDFLLDFIKNTLKRLISTLIPAILNLLLAFGIDQLNKLTSDTICPKKNKLDEIIKLRNNIVDELNKISKTLDTLIKSIGIIQGLSQVLSVAINVFFIIPIPAAFIPQGILTLASDSVRKLQNLLSKFNNISSTVLIALMILKFVLALIISLLQQLDKLIKQCDPLSQLDELDNNLKSIQNEINDIDVNGDINPKLNRRTINGFNLDIQNVDELSNNGLISRQAIGMDDKGVILIKGEPSYSYDGNVLLDELEFYILKNDLKAY